jgi:hypothetical protein
MHTVYCSVVFVGASTRGGRSGKLVGQWRLGWAWPGVAVFEDHHPRLARYYHNSDEWSQYGGQCSIYACSGFDTVPQSLGLCGRT